MAGGLGRRKESTHVGFTIILDEQRCELHGECVVAAPGVFAIGSDDDDEVTLLTHDVPDDLSEQVRDAVDSCPVQALRIED
jgi:ferredoxin